MFPHTSQPCTFERDCEVVMIPVGDQVTIPAGTVGYITQALGGSFTVFIDGNLFRIAGIDADAIGKEPVLPPTLPDDATEDDIERLLWDQMKTVYDPEIPVNIVDLGLIYRCEMRLDDQGDRIVEVAGAPYHFDGEPVRARHAPPLLGEQSTEILTEAGYTREEIDSLIASGAVQAYSGAAYAPTSR